MPFIGKKIETTKDIFMSLVEKDCLLVDKTLFLKEFVNGPDISLITRQRRSGKTLLMTMCQAFFSDQIIGIPTQGLFDQFAIAGEENGEFIKKHQGQYPVIFITLKDVRESTYEATLSNIKGAIQDLYCEHKYLLSSENIDKDDALQYQQYLDGTVNQEDLEKSLKRLTQFLYKASGKKRVIILIDEYDSPLINAYYHGFVEKLTDFMRGFFSGALKSNQHLEKGLMTGILRVSQNNMLSELNNLEVYTLLDNTYSQYFGFTETEVMELVEHFNYADITLDKVKKYYNGYNIGDTVIYNPWSVMKCLGRKALAPYWVLTSNDKIIQKILLTGSEETRAKFAKLMLGQSIEGDIDVNLRYEDLMGKPHALWTLLTFCGYLTIDSKKNNFGTRAICWLKIPNLEILAQYQEIFSDWLTETLGERPYHTLLSSLVSGEIETFTQILQHYLKDSLSFKDVSGEKQSEKFYHGFVSGLVAGVRDTHWIDSNKESGFGLYDLILTPKDPVHPIGIVIEFKQVPETENLNAAAQAALNPINQLQYHQILSRYAHVKRILKVGIAFCGKNVVSVYQEEANRITPIDKIA